MQVGMLHLFEHGIHIVFGRLTQHITGKGHGKCHLSGTGRPTQQQGMWHLSTAIHALQALFGLLLSYHIVKCHALMLYRSFLATSATDSTADTV